MAYLLQVLWCCNRQCHQVANGLMETRVSARTERNRLVFVLYVILNVTHFMMNGNEVPVIHRCALLDSKIFAIAKVPGRSMTNDYAVFRLLNY